MIYVTSDWHGYSLDGIKALLSAANFGESDFLYVLGDVVDRGDHAAELLKFLLYAPNMQLILGNHEQMLLACDWVFEEISDEAIDKIDSDRISVLVSWKENGAEKTIASLCAESPETRQAILEYLRDCPIYENVSVGDRDYFLVHGGFKDYSADKKLKDYSTYDLLWARPNLGEQYSSDFITIVGHTPTCCYSSYYRNRMIKNRTWWNIDTGSACGYAPMLLCLDTLREYYLNENGSVTVI